MSATACQLCGKTLSRIRLLREGDFCCREHREEYRLRRGIHRVLEASAVSQLERRKERPQLMPILRPAADAGAGAFRVWDTAPPLGRPACDCFAPSLEIAAGLRPAHAGHAAAPAWAAEPARAATRRPDFRPLRLRGSVVTGNWSSAGRPIAGVAGFGFPGCCPLVVPAAAAARPRAGSVEALRPSGRACRQRTAGLRLRSAADRYRLAGRPLDRALARLHAPASVSPRPAPVVRFPSGDPANAAPVPPARRRPGVPACAPAGGLRTLLPPLVAAPPPRHRAADCSLTLAARHRVSEPRPSGGGFSIGPAALPAIGRPEFRLEMPAAHAAPEKRHPGAPPIVSVALEDGPLTVPPFEALPAGAAMELRCAARPLEAAHPPAPAPSRRPELLDFPRRASCLPACRLPGKAHTPRPMPAPFSPVHAMAHAPAARAARGASIPPAAAPAPELPRRAAASSAVAPSLAPPLPGVAPPPAAAVFRVRQARQPFALPALSCPAAALSLQGTIGGTLGDVETLEDHFGSGLGRWIGGIADWRLDAAGARTGSLALFSPSLGMRDYDLEFLAKIDRRSVGWVFRAADFKSYYLVRISRARQGRDDALELTRYAVVGGVPDSPITVPLPVTVRSRAAFRVLTSVSGADFTVAVEGQVVDGWSDGRLAAGGIGFLAEPEDGARLYWVKLAACGRLAAPGRTAGMGSNKL